MRLRSMALIGVAGGLCIISTCISPDPFPPLPMTAPSFTAIEITAVHVTDAYRMAVRLQWDLTGKDSLPVSQFVVFRKKTTDSAFIEILREIPDSQFECWDILDASDLPRQGDYATIWYRIAAVDTLERFGDTSASDSIQLSWPPRIIQPSDTLNDNLFKWSTILYRGGYYTSMYLWGSSQGFIWKSPRPSEPTYGGESADSHSVVLPSPPRPLARGIYYCGVKIEIPGANIQSMALHQFYAP